MRTSALTHCWTSPPPLTLTHSHAQLASDSQATDHRGPLLEFVSKRLRDTKLRVRKEAASGLAQLMRSWLLQVQRASEAADGPVADGGNAAAERERDALQVAAVLCNVPSKGLDLGPYVLDTVLRHGLFPQQLPVAEQARLWVSLWSSAGGWGRQVAQCTLMACAAVDG